MRRGAGRNGSTIRMQNLRDIATLIEQQFDSNGKSLSLKRTLALIDWNYGITTRTGLTYLDSLENMDALHYNVKANWLRRGSPLDYDDK